MEDSFAVVAAVVAAVVVAVAVAVVGNFAAV